MIEYNAIAGSTTRTSTRNIKKVDAGIASLAKSIEVPRSKPAAFAAAGFLMGVGRLTALARRHLRDATESVPVRLARRRLIAGPIPVVFHETGRYRYTH